MSYGHPCSSMTTGPLAGPSSAYPMLRTPVMTCFRGPNDVLVPGGGLEEGAESASLAFAKPAMANSATAKLIAEAPKKRRRLGLICSDIGCLILWKGSAQRNRIGARAIQD